MVDIVILLVDSSVAVVSCSLALSVRMRMMQRLAVVGAGATGLCAARHILSRPNVFTPPVVFELTDNIGGTWCYDERVGTYDNGRPIHSSMYRDLRYAAGRGSSVCGRC